MEPDEIQVAIDRAEAKRRELETTLQSAAKLSAKIVSALPKAADLYPKAATAPVTRRCRFFRRDAF